MSWCPLFPQITGSSVWDLPPHIFKSWISIISHKNHETHTWRGNAYTLAKQATISLEQAKEAMKVLSEPDERSLTKDHDGKRIISDDGENWFVVNSEKYQEMIKREIALENARARTAKWRKNKKSSTGNNGVDAAKTPMNPAAASRFVAPTESEVLLRCAKSGIPEIEGRKFFNYWDEMGWKNKAGPVKDWHKRLARWKLDWESKGRPGSGPVSDPDAPPPKSDWKAYEAWALKQVLR